MHEQVEQQVIYKMEQPESEIHTMELMMQIFLTYIHTYCIGIQFEQR